MKEKRPLPRAEDYKSQERTDGCIAGLLGVWLTRLPLPNTNGFLSAFCCSMTYAIFGTSRHISIGSFSILNMAATNILKTLNFNQTLSSNGSPDNYSDPSQALTLAASITFLTGIIQLLLGCCCLGLVKTYVPKPLIDACLTAAAVHVIVAQLTFIFDIVLDIPASPLDIFYNLFHFFLAIPKANATSILLFLLSMAVLQVTASVMIVYKRSLMAFPLELLLIITVTIISNFIHLHAESSNAVVSMIPQRFLPPTVPDVSNLNKVILHAFSIAIVSYFLLVFVGERYASLHSYRIASNQVRTQLHILPRRRNKLNLICKATNYLTVVEMQVNMPDDGFVTTCYPSLWKVDIKSQ